MLLPACSIGLIFGANKRNDIIFLISKPANIDVSTFVSILVKYNRSVQTPVLMLSIFVCPGQLADLCKES